MKTQRGFTLIELLVVISIIALLLAILMPSLTAAKKQAQAIVCMSNHRGLIQGYRFYLDDNDQKLPSAIVWGSNHAWVHPPTLEDGTIRGGAGEDVLLEDRLRGIERGSMFPYVGSVEVYRCPGDLRLKRGTDLGSSPAYQMYRTYSIQGGLNGEEKGLNQHGEKICPKKSNDIKNVAQVYVFVEEFYDGKAGNFNTGSWQLDMKKNGESWWNVVAMWHRDRGTLSFLDGHAETLKWTDIRTIKFAEFRDPSDYTQADNPDLEYMTRRYAVPLPRKNPSF